MNWSKKLSRFIQKRNHQTNHHLKFHVLALNIVKLVITMFIKCSIKLSTFFFEILENSFKGFVAEIIKYKNKGLFT